MNYDRFLTIRKLCVKLSKDKAYDVEKSLYLFSNNLSSYNLLLNTIIENDLSIIDDVSIAKIYMINSIKRQYEKGTNTYWENYLKDYQNYVKNLVENFTSEFLDIINDISKEVEEEIKIVKKIETLKVVEEEEYIPASISEKQLKIIKNSLSLPIFENFSNRGNKLNEKDLFTLVNMDYDDLVKIYDNLKIEPEVLTHVPIQYAKKGVSILYKLNPIGFVIDGTFPEFEISYRYKNENDEVCTELEKICDWVGVKYKKEKLPNNIFSKTTNYEKDLMKHLHTFKNNRFVLMLDKRGDILNFEILAEKIESVKSRSNSKKISGKISDNEKFKEVEKLIISGLEKTKKYQEEFKYKYICYLLFGNVTRNDLRELIKLRPTQKFVPSHRSDKISILYNKFTNEVLKRKIMKSDHVRYPIPMYYDQYNFPVFSRSQKKILEYLLNGEFLNPMLCSKIHIKYIDEISHEDYKRYNRRIVEITDLMKIKNIEISKLYENDEENLLEFKKQEYSDLVDEKTKLEYECSRYNKMIFEGSVPFVIEENSNKYMESYYYVEQVYKDKKYGLPIVFKIGVNIDKPVCGCLKIETHEEIIRKYNINVEMELTNKYFKGLMSSQSETDYFELQKLENYSIDRNNILTSGAYSLLDSHNLLNEDLKYDPDEKKTWDDVWLWDPARDYKANAKDDANMWEKEKKFILEELKKALKEEGGSSSAFIGFKNECTKYLQNFRLNLPSQVYRKFHAKQQIPKPSKEIVINYITNNQPFSHEFDIQKMIKYGLIKIDERSVDLLTNLSTYFQNYKTFNITYEHHAIGETKFESLKNSENTSYNPYEILYGTLINMSNTTELTYSEDIIEYVNNIDSLDDLDSEEYSKLLSKHPILKILYFLSKEDKKDNLWNILSCILTKWYTPKYDTKEVKIGDRTRYTRSISGKLIKYSFENQINITPEDILNYIGDNHYKNCMYNKGYREIDVAENVNISCILTPGGKFEQIDKNIENNKFVKKIIISKEMTGTIPVYMNAMLISDEDDLHKQYGITHNSARRCALVYNVDLPNVEPYFGTANVLTTFNKKMNYALTKDDILKYLEKRGNVYNILEMSDAEIEERKKLKMINEKYLNLRDIQFNYYKGALLKYYSSDNSKNTMKNLLVDSKKGLRVSGKHLIKLDNNTLIKYRDAIDDAIDKKKIRKNKGDIEKYISMLSIFPDFIDDTWYIREKFVNDEFEKKFGITVKHFLSNKKREIDMTISMPKEFLDIHKVVDLPF